MRYVSTVPRSVRARRFGRWIPLMSVFVLVVSCDDGGSGAVFGPSANALDLAAVELTPQTVTLIAGGSNQFTAVAILPDGSAIVPEVIWSSTGGTITATGLFTAGTVSGTFQVSAQIKGRSPSGSAPVIVTPVSLTIGR
jgi:hypothetical protein